MPKFLHNMSSGKNEITYADARTIADKAGISGADPTSNTALWKEKVLACTKLAQGRVGTLTYEHVRTLACAIAVAARPKSGNPRPYGFGTEIRNMVESAL